MFDPTPYYTAAATLSAVVSGLFHILRSSAIDKVKTYCHETFATKQDADRLLDTMQDGFKDLKADINYVRSGVDELKSKG